MALTYYYDLASVSTFTNNDARDTKTKLNSNFALLNTNVIGIDNRFEFALDALFGNVILDGLAITYGGTGLSFTAGAGSALIGTRIQVSSNTTVTVLGSQSGAKIYLGNDGAFYTAIPAGIDYMEYVTYSSDASNITAIKITARTATLGASPVIEVAGTAKANKDALILRNITNAADMDGTGTALTFQQWYYHATAPAADDSGRIAAITEQDWTDTASTRDSALAFSVSVDGTLVEYMRIKSTGVNIGAGAAGIDYTLTFDGETNDCVITWMEDEDYLKFNDDIMFPDNERVYLGTAADAGIYYDGTNSNFDSDLVAPSDLIIDCGTDKTLVLEETVWKDIQVPAHSVKTGASAPGFDGTAAGDATLLTYAFDGASVEQVYFTIQMPHDWKEGTTIFPHVHFSPTADSGAVEKGVSWKLEYTWANNAATFGASAEIEMTKAFTDAQWDHLIATNDTGISGAGKTISSILVCRLYRDPTDGDDTFENDVLFLGFDIHYEVEKLGSRQQYVS